MLKSMRPLQIAPRLTRENGAICFLWLAKYPHTCADIFIPSEPTTRGGWAKNPILAHPVAKGKLIELRARSGILILYILNI